MLVIGGGVTGDCDCVSPSESRISTFALLERERLSSRDSGHTTAHLTYVNRQSVACPKVWWGNCRPFARTWVAWCDGMKQKKLGTIPVTALDLVRRARFCPGPPKLRSRRPERCHSSQDQREQVSALSHARIYWQVAPAIETLSMRHPGAALASSEPMRHRSVIVCPATFGPKLTTVSI